MNTQHQRYVFTDFDHIQKVKFKKLEKVCNKLFIMIDSSVQYIPFSLVRDTQKLGRAVKWLPVAIANDNSVNFNICYLMGKMHTKLDKDIQFAVLSDDDSIDSLISAINSSGRSCIRVGRKIQPKNVTPKPEPSPKKDDNGEKPAPEPQDRPVTYPSKTTEKEIVAYIAHATLERLAMTSQRPYDLNTLGSYIQMNNQELIEKRKLKMVTVIEYLIEKGYIQLINEVVHYNIPNVGLQDS